jgi:hypothetical protein
VALQQTLKSRFLLLFKRFHLYNNVGDDFSQQSVRNVDTSNVEFSVQNSRNVRDESDDLQNRAGLKRSSDYICTWRIDCAKAPRTQVTVNAFLVPLVERFIRSMANRSFLGFSAV